MNKREVKGAADLRVWSKALRYGAFASRYSFRYVFSSVVRRRLSNV